jgi:methylaspartate mutase epsilon subunit
LNTRETKTLVVGSVGGDAHSVGLTILSRYLVRAGYEVRCLGCQCSVSHLCAEAAHADAVLVSNMDGHAPYYLRDLPVLRDGADNALWYVGGNPIVHDDATAMGSLLDLGFTRIVTGCTDLRDVVAMLDADLGVRGAAEGYPATGCPEGPATLPGETGLPAASLLKSSVPVAAEPFTVQRIAVLAQWHTGSAARDLRANASAMRQSSSLADALRRADREGTLLVQPRSGVPTVAEQSDIFRRLHEAGADVLSFQIDSLTRNNAYEEAAQRLKDEVADRSSFFGLNGFPLVNHGVAGVRPIVHELADVPFQVRHSTRDPRLLAEISFAAGVPAFEGGAITYNLPYFRDYDPRAAVANWRYVDTLAGSYREQFGVTIDREFFGVLTAELVPPCLAVAADVLEALLAAAAGVTSVSLGYAEQGNRAQDMAAISALRQVGREYLDRYGYDEVAVSTVFHQYMGAFPENPAKARELLSGSAATARASGATRLMLKTYSEAVCIPSAADNVDSMNLVRRAIAMARPGDHADRTQQLSEEEDVIAAESRAIIDSALELGREDFGEAVVAGIAAAVIDVPFSPSRWNAGEAMAIRDDEGAVRFIDVGRIPLPACLRDREIDLARRRLTRERTSPEEAAERDILSIARGEFPTWPLG